MIFYRNFHRRFQNKQEEVEAIRQLNGRDLPDGTTFELISLVLKKAQPHPEKKHGFQDTDITHNQDGSIVIVHRQAGTGTLRFEPNNYGNPVGFLTKTEHNMEMLVKCYGQKEWTYQDKDLEKEVKAKFDIYWDKMSKDDKTKYKKNEEYKKMDVFDSPSIIPQQTGAVKTDMSMDKLMDEMTQLRMENAQLKANVKEPANAIIKEEPTPVAPPPPPPIDSTIVTDKAGKMHDFASMMLFQVRTMAKEYGVAYTKDSKKEEIVPLLIEAIEKQKDAVPVG